jgi:glutamate carboxypeptidase
MPDVFDIQRCALDLETSLPAYLADLNTLVSIDSGTFDKEGTDAVTGILRGRYERMGGFVETRPHSTYGDAILAVFEGKGTGSVLLLGHTDTVYPAGTARRRPFKVEGSKAFGPGTSDMKAGDLAILYAIDAICKQGWDGFGRIEVLHNSDEEIGSPSSREFVRARAEHADAVLVLEAGRENGDVVSARKGIVDCRLEVLGRSAHAGVSHHLGRSAALELAHLVVNLEAINGTLPGVSLNVGHIQAGERTNVVPDRASAHLEVRAMEREYLEVAVDRVREVVAHRTVEGTEATAQIEIAHYPMQKSEGTTWLLNLAQSIAADLDFKLQDTATGGASDGNTAAAAGRPVLDGLGPIGGGAHSLGEYVSIPSIVPRTALLAGLIAAVGQGFKADKGP